MRVLSRVVRFGDLSPGPVSFVFFLSHFHKSVSFASFLAPQVLHCCLLFGDSGWLLELVGSGAAGVSLGRARKRRRVRQAGWPQQTDRCAQVNTSPENKSDSQSRHRALPTVLR